MMDANEAYSEAVEYTLTPDGTSGWLLTVSADPEWIEDSDRVFPVTIDPTLIDQTETQDFNGKVANEANTIVSTNNNVACGYNTDYGMMEIYFKLDLPTTPAGATLVRSQVGFRQCDYRPQTTGATLILYMSQITQSTTISGIIWATRPSIGTYLDYAIVDPSTTPNWVYWDVTEAAKSWYENGNNYGLAMTSDASSSKQYRAWFAYDSNGGKRITFWQRRISF